MKTLPSNPRKAEEMDHFRKFVQNLPEDSYLHAILAGAPDAVEKLILNDFAYDPLPDLLKAQREAHDELKKLQQECAKKQQEAKDAENRLTLAKREKDRITEDIAELRKVAARIAACK
jgi:hypothetical protein